MADSNSGTAASTYSKTDDLEKQADLENDSSNTMDHEKPSSDPNVVNWDGPDDPENPMNWPKVKKNVAIGIVSLITMLSPLASTIIAPAVGDVMSEFGTSNETIGAFVTSVFLLGYVTGPLFLAPLSEIFGRSIIYNVCNTIFLIFNIACAVANNISALIVFRLFAGIASSCPITIGSGTIADLIPAERRGLAMSLWIMGPILGPTFGPLIGAFLAQAKGWRWIFWLLTILSGAVWIASLVYMRETYAPVILARKTARLRKETGNPNLRSALHTDRSASQLLMISILRPLKMLFLSPITLIISLYMSLIYGYLYLLFTTFGRVFQGQYGFSNGILGLVYIGTGVGSLIGLFVCGAFSDRIVNALTVRNGGSRKPEYRLPLMIVGALTVPIGLFLYGWTAEYRVHWIVPIIGEGFLGVGLFMVFTYLVDAFTQYAASVSAAATVLRSLLGALLPLAGNSMYNALGVGWGTSLLGFIAVAFIPVPFVLFKYGERIRTSKWSQVQF